MRQNIFIIFMIFITPLKSHSVINENQAEEIIQRLDNLYKKDQTTIDLMKKYNRNFNIYYLPDEEFVFGFEGIWGQANNRGEIFIAGGAIKNLFFTEETFLALVCHEIGHLLGGWPNDKTYLSYEGQADYYAANICMKKYYIEYPEQLQKKSHLHQYYFDLCEKTYTTDRDIRICVKTMQGGLNLAIASALSIQEIIIPGPGVNESFQTPTTLEGRDSAQCISDTFEAGALCVLDPYRNIELSDNKEQYCDNRPKCWFNENKIKSLRYSPIRSF